MHSSHNHMEEGVLPVTIESVAYYLPEGTEDGEVLVRDNPDWRIDDIERKTGVRTRHVASSDETTIEMAVHAAERVFAGGVRRDKIGFVLLVTQSPDDLIPTSACVLQDRLGLSTSCLAFDVNLGCSGFVYGLAMGGSLIAGGLAKKGLILCSERYTSLIRKDDRTCRPIFSDGAAATVITESAAGRIGPFIFGTDGSGAKNLCISEGSLKMEGASVFQFTLDIVPKTVTAVLQRAEKTLNDIDLIIFHQASKLVLDNVIRRLELPEEKVFINMEHVGNTVSATIPIALRDAVDQGRLKDGDTVMLVGFGVGYSWGACLMEWKGI